MKWTEEQRQAIELRDKNLLVSAAAGSGKTAVLVERIRRLIIEDGCSVDRMLIVTFTNAAAAEMKEKIRRSLTETLEEAAAAAAAGEDSHGGARASAGEAGHGCAQAAARRNYLKRQLDLLPSANISTFHAFALEVIRRYFYLIGIEPNFKICDSTEESLLKGEAMDELLSSLFAEGETEFFRFLKSYSGDRDESRFREMIAGCYNTMRSLPEPFVWLEESVEQLKDGRGLESGSVREGLLAAAEEKLSAARHAIAANEETARRYGLTQLLTLCEQDKAQLDRLSAAAGSHDEFREALAAFKLPAMSSKIFAARTEEQDEGKNGADGPGAEELKKTVSAGRDLAKKLIKELKEVYFTGSIDEMKRELAATYEPACYLQKLLRRYDELYREAKRAKNLLDFSDIEHYAFEILKDEEAAGFYRQRFEHIFIDEYQDSNVIQEALIDQIKRGDNLFMVGDVKQSIYKFRLAEPEIFQRKYRYYCEGLAGLSQKLDLNKNFRSKKQVIDFINGIFSAIMSGYDDNAALHAGDPHAEEGYCRPLLCLAQTPWDEDTELDEELKNLIKAEKEALSAVRLIRESLGQEIFDSRRGVRRTLAKRDIVILMRGVKNYGEIFYKILTENDLPAYIDDSDGFFDTLEIDSFLAALRIIDNPKQDVPLLTLLRSEMLGFTIEELVDVRIAHKQGSYYEAFTSYAQVGPADALRDKCASALAKIASWRQLSQLLPLDKLIWRLLLDSGFYLAMGALPAGSQRQANLRALTDKALAYGASGGGSLYGFIQYVEAIRENKVSMGQVKLLGENDDLVRIMTVHKSKGLEFPMVVMAGCCRRLNYSSSGRSPLMHKDLGLGFPLVDKDNRWYRTTLMQDMIKDRIRREEVEEEKRILYVALTRAMDRLFLLGICNDVHKEIEKVCAEAPGAGSYFSMAGRVICRDLKAVRLLADEELAGMVRGRRRSVERILKTMDEALGRQAEAGGAENAAAISVSPEIARLLDYSYPYKDEMNIKSKYAVSELARAGDAERQPALREPDLREPVLREPTLREPIFAAREERQLSAAARGSAYHTVLEHLDVCRARAEGKSYVEALLQKLTEREVLFAPEAAAVDGERILAFAASELGGRLAASRAVYRERAFNMITEYEGRRLMVQGVIDCYFEEEDGLVLLDYKTGNAADARLGRDEKIAARYRTQIELYRQALEEASGRRVKEAYLYLTDAGRFIAM